jgi:hypothetical protein
MLCEVVGVDTERNNLVMHASSTYKHMVMSI